MHLWPALKPAGSPSTTCTTVQEDKQGFTVTEAPVLNVDEVSHIAANETTWRAVHAQLHTGGRPATGALRGSATGSCAAKRHGTGRGGETRNYCNLSVHAASTAQVESLYDVGCIACASSRPQPI